MRPASRIYSLIHSKTRLSLIIVVEWNYNKMKKSTIWLLFAILISVIIVVWFNYTEMFFDISLSDIKNKTALPDNAGVFGDVYGSLNTLFSGVAFAALFISILFQSAELSATREEMKNQGDQFKKQTEMLDKQSFENSLFQLMSFNNELIQSLKVEINRSEYDRANKSYKTVVDTITGRQVFSKFFTYIDESATRGAAQGQLMSPSDLYVAFYEENEDKLGPYFQGLYQTIKLIDESSYDAVVKKKYVDLIVAQTSKYEMYLLFYHGLSELGNSGFKCLLERYEFFEFYPKEFNISWRDMLGYDVSVFGWADKKKFKNYLLAYTKVDNEWLGSRRIIAYVDGYGVPFDITDDVGSETSSHLKNNLIKGIETNKLIWIELADNDSGGCIDPAGEVSDGHKAADIFELPTKRYVEG